MGGCLSVLNDVLKPAQQQQQPQANANGGGAGCGGSALSYAAAAAGSALHSLADHLEAQGHHESNRTGRPPSELPLLFTIQDAFVKSMPDGDTLTVEVPGKPQSRVRVRVFGIDCPEFGRDGGQNFGKEAMQKGRAMLLHRRVTVYVHDTDRYGRHVASVMVNGQDYAKEMLRSGAAWHYKAYDTREEMAELEREARQKSVGLWSAAGEDPVEPWEYRRRKRERENAKKN